MFNAFISADVALDYGIFCVASFIKSQPMWWRWLNCNFLRASHCSLRWPFNVQSVIKVWRNWCHRGFMESLNKMNGVVLCLVAYFINHGKKIIKKRDTNNPRKIKFENKHTKISTTADYYGLHHSKWRLCNATSYELNASLSWRRSKLGFKLWEILPLMNIVSRFGRMKCWCFDIIW